jgi:hypothetical protein
MQTQINFSVSGKYDLVRATNLIDKAIKKSGAAQYNVHCLPNAVEVTVSGGRYSQAQILECVAASVG